MVNSRCPIDGEATTSARNLAGRQPEKPGAGVLASCAMQPAHTADPQSLTSAASGCELYPGWSTQKCADPVTARLLLSFSHEKPCQQATSRLALDVCAPHHTMLKEGAFLSHCAWCDGGAFSFREV